MKKIALSILCLASNLFASEQRFPDEEGIKRILRETARYSTKEIPAVSAEHLFTVTNKKTTPVYLYVDIEIEDRYGLCPKSFSARLRPDTSFSKIRRDLGDEFNSARSLAEGVRINKIEIRTVDNGRATLLGVTDLDGHFTINE